MAVLKKSPAITTKSTFFSIMRFIALLKAFKPKIFSFSSLQPPRCTSAKCAKKTIKTPKIQNFYSLKFYFFLLFLLNVFLLHFQTKEFL